MCYPIENEPLRLARPNGPVQATQLLQEIDKAALVCPCRYRGTGAIRAPRRRAARISILCSERPARRGLRRCV